MRRYPANNPIHAVPSAIVQDLVADWRVHGHEAIRRVRQWAPQRYIQLVAALAPPGITAASEYDAMSDDELRAALKLAVEDSYTGGLLPGWTPPPGTAIRAPFSDD